MVLLFACLAGSFPGAGGVVVPSSNRGAILAGAGEGISISVRDEEMLRQDKMFWEGLWAAEVKELESLLQLATAPASAVTSAPAPGQRNGTETHEVLSSGQGAVDARAASQLAPALAMLEGLVQQAKERIAGLNTRENESKVCFAEKEAEYKARMADLENQTQAGKLPKEFIANSTASYERIFKYWKGVRERAHHQYHNALNIQHGIIQKGKAMIKLYQEAIAGKLDPKVLEERVQRLTGSNPIGLLQDARLSLKSFCESALRQIASFRMG